MYASNENCVIKSEIFIEMCKITDKENLLGFTSSQLFLLVTLRIVIGWHFLYEGIAKLTNPAWTSYSYLIDSKGFLSGLMVRCASNSGIVDAFDFLNMWGLTAIGIGLILGCLTRISIIGGISLLTVYYLSHAPFVGAQYMLPSEGSYLWVNKNLIELVALAVLYVYPTQKIIGLDRLFFIGKKKSLRQTL